MPESAYGPTNNSIGIGDILRRRGHRVVFAAEASWKGKLEALGFEEDLVDLAPPAEEEQDAGQFWKDFIRETAPEYRKSTLEQLETVTKPIWESLIDGVKYCEPQLKAIIERVRPDVIVEDNVITFPALLTTGKKFVRIVSCNPLEVRGENVPPVFSGLPAADRSEWDAFRAEYDRTHREVWAAFNEWCVEQGTRPLPDLDFIHEGDLNLYVYPEILDYTAERPLGPTWHRLDSSVRETDEEFELPFERGSSRREGDEGADEERSGRDHEHERGDGALVYFSLGSLGSSDVELMQRVIDVLATTPHRYIVSKGPLHEEIKLAENMWGAEFLPQTKIIPLCDLVITHGGNNTTTEALHFGKPMILLPLFWDQYDNAQRVDELGYGVRLATYAFTDEELTGALDRLLGDEELRARLAAAGEEIRGRDGLRRAADLIERLGQE
ncbi:nucleotide disphospho-sugar-binding domain-containing protein [Nonomuraea muscovyensis]|uniref:UDP:flavonoid glycosyltransferase YjiC (YdhE family) n=1 Tax=Nonomuraea muscovyensis TaxID=1124761 RepID=A0A7X0CB47_9ACTN|nr:nucleotide disphospho-sugar-binding domain-containing protein [Nonomuraea muscovyensis]MBB6351912.1 UDP:flavonoid glycosyltransferase YjiC (YdhE family) [Nonomuraea muscovyensis]